MLSWFVGSAAESTGFFLPQNPVAAAYVLGRLSNQELIDAPRSEFVYAALLQRKGLDSKYRLEALDNLAKLHRTNRVAEIVRAVSELAGKSGTEETLRDLGSVGFQFSRPEFIAQRESIQALSSGAQLALARQVAFSWMIYCDSSPEPLWTRTQATPERLPDLIGSVALLPAPELRELFYGKLKTLVLESGPSEIRRAAIEVLPAIPNHDAESAAALSKLALQSTEMPATLSSLKKVPNSAWPKDQLEPLSAALLAYLQAFPAEEKTSGAFGVALQAATDLATLLPAEKQRELTHSLRGIGPSLVTLHAVYEQMRFDKDLIVVETGKRVVMTLQNDDAMPHNLAILAQGALQEIGLAAEKMPPEPDDEGRLYVPASPKLLHATQLVSPGQHRDLAFDAPELPGDYPFVCTFPGHWLRMSGTLKVVPDLDEYLSSHPASQTPQLTEWKLSDFADTLAQGSTSGNADAGRELFARLACIQCHQIGGKGYAFGPDLTDVLKRYKNDRTNVLEQILEPSKIITDRYRNIYFDLKNGDSLVGVIVKEDNETVTVQTGPADSLIQTLNKPEIRRRRNQTSSPMPVGLLGSLSKPQVLDLLAFLQSGGSPPEHAHHH
jgi:putative heme-binding domain-containing protein